MTTNPLPGRMAVSSTRCQYGWLSKHLSSCNWFYFALDMNYQNYSLRYSASRKHLLSDPAAKVFCLAMRASEIVTVPIRFLLFSLKEECFFLYEEVLNSFHSWNNGHLFSVRCYKGRTFVLNVQHFLTWHRRTVLLFITCSQMPFPKFPEGNRCTRCIYNVLCLSCFLLERGRLWKKMLYEYK